MLPCRAVRFVVLLSAAGLTFAGPLAAQSVVTVLPSQCVWRAGDNLAWAAPTLDESGWRPYSSLKLDPSRPRIWVRCDADLSALRGVAQPAVQVRLYSAYELYLNGQQLGGSGNLRTGNFSLNAIRSYSLAGSHSGSSPSTLALRITEDSPVTNSGPLLGLIASGMELRAGERFVLDALRSNAVLARSSRYIATAICFGIIGVIAIMLMGLYLSDRSHRELLLLSLTCLGVALLRLNEFGAASMLNFSIRTSLALVVVGNVTHVLTEVPFFYALAQRRVPRIMWALLIVSALAFSPSVISIVRSSDQLTWLDPLNRLLVHAPAIAINMVLSLAPFLVFWPYSRIDRRERPLAVLCMLWGVADFVWFAVEITGIPLPGLPDFFATWGQTLLEIRAFTTAGVLAALLGLLFREQRQVTEERAQFAGEVNAARNVQQYLIPDHLPVTPGFTVESAYRPSREVGGDFFQVLPHADDGSLLIVIGDVAGKGIEAGMLATLIVGAVRTAASFTSDPASILALLNERLCGRGLVTCLALRMEQDGTATLVNAGHIPPYLNGKEMAVDGALPLGAVRGMQFPASHFQLAEGDSLVLLTDGVVEARNPTGELFGFERTRAISTRTAEEIAGAALQFGQEDDITVLTLIMAAAPETLPNQPAVAAKTLA